MPLLSSSPDSPHGPLLPGGEALSPLKGLDPTSLIKALQQQSAMKHKLWGKMTEWEQPELGDLEGLPIDADYLGNEYYSAINNIKEGIIKAGGNAQYYLGTDEGKAQMRRALGSPGQLNALREEKESFDLLREGAKGKGQNIWLTKNQTPIIDANTGEALTINDMLQQYQYNPAYSPFHGGTRDATQDMTTMDEAYTQLQLYFNQVKTSAYGSNEITPGTLEGVGNVYSNITKKGFSSIPNIERVMEENGGLENNLSPEVLAGLTRGFHQNRRKNYADYIDETTGQFNDDYYKDKHKFIYGEIKRAADEMIHTKHEEYETIKGVPGGSGGDQESGYTRFDQAALNLPGYATAGDTRSSVYVGTTGDKEYEYVTVQNLRNYELTTNPFDELLNSLVQSANVMSSQTGEDTKFLPSLDQIVGGTFYAYMDDKHGVTHPVDLSKTGNVDISEILVKQVTNIGREEVKPGIQLNPAGQLQPGILSLSIAGYDKDGDPIHDINKTNLINNEKAFGDQDQDRANHKTATIGIDVLYPLEAFTKLAGFTMDNPAGKLEAIDAIGTGSTGFNPFKSAPELKERFEGMGGAEDKSEGAGLSSRPELKEETVNGRKYVKVRMFVPFGPRHATIGSSEKNQRNQQSKVQFEIGQQAQESADDTQNALNILNQNYDQ